MHPNIYITIKDDVIKSKPVESESLQPEGVETIIEQPINTIENRFNSIPFNEGNLTEYTNNIKSEFPDYAVKDKILLNGLLFNKTIYKDGVNYYNIQIDNNGEFVPEEIEINLNGNNVNLENGVFKNNTTEYKLIPVFDEKGNSTSRYTLEETSNETIIESTESININEAQNYITTNTGLLFSQEQTDLLKVYAEDRNTTNYTNLVESFMKTIQDLNKNNDIQEIFNYKDEYMDFKSSLNDILDNKNECKQN